MTQRQAAKEIDVDDFMLEIRGRLAKDRYMLVQLLKALEPIVAKWEQLDFMTMPATTMLVEAKEIGNARAVILAVKAYLLGEIKE
jgi:hypothetical protein